jgi:hypothetical protein
MRRDGRVGVAEIRTHSRDISAAERSARGLSFRASAASRGIAIVPSESSLIVWETAPCAGPLGTSISRGARGGTRRRGERLSWSSLLHRRGVPLQPRLQQATTSGSAFSRCGAAGFHSPPRAPRLRVQCSSQRATAGSRGGAENAENGLRGKVFSPQPKKAFGIVDGEEIEPPPESRPREQSSAPPRASAASA